MVGDEFIYNNNLRLHFLLASLCLSGRESPVLTLFTVFAFAQRSTGELFGVTSVQHFNSALRGNANLCGCLSTHLICGSEAQSPPPVRSCSHFFREG